jgi:3-hydroxyisobutyrate dehydrogenase-like beta-hydroxyacid dehydrogenase
VSTVKETPRAVRIAVIGFGEAGSILGEDLAKAGQDVSTYDILMDGVATRATLLEKARRAGVQPAHSLADCLQGAEVVVSAVTAAASGDVAKEAARHLRPGQFFLDINSVAPATKRANASAVETSGADYVEAAVMAAVPPQRLKVPILLGGPRAAALEPLLRRLGLSVTTVDTRVGTASAIKMCRSILIKGLEALTAECLLAARAFGAEDRVLSSLARTYPQMGWEGGLPDYLVSRIAEHGRRRAAEMSEVAATLRSIGLQPLMAEATAERQQWLVDRLAEAGIPYQPASFSWRALADALNAHLGKAPQ